MSLYSDYAKEMHGRTVIETDCGFISFGEDSGLFIIHDLYVIPEARRSREGTRLADMASEVAVTSGHREIWAKIIPSVSGQSAAMAAQLAYGFRIVSSGPDYILLKKEIYG